MRGCLMQAHFCGVQQSLSNQTGANFTLLLSLSCCWLTAQCPTETNIISTTQADIDNFPIAYPGCTEIEYSVAISGSGINNLNGLANLRSIGGSLYIQSCTALDSLSGLDSLQTIGESFCLEGNNAFKNLHGLENLNSIGFGGLIIYLCDSLTSLSGLENLQSVKLVLSISDNNSLASLNGLENLQSLELLAIEGNSSLTTLSGLLKL